MQDIQIAEADTAATVSGVIRNKTLKSGATGTIDFQLLGFDGKAIGTAPITFTVPSGAAAGVAEPEKIKFSVTIPTNAPIASWTYRTK